MNRPSYNPVDQWSQILWNGNSFSFEILRLVYIQFTSSNCVYVQCSTGDRIFHCRPMLALLPLRKPEIGRPR
jgi:hypothetical protein